MGANTKIEWAHHTVNFWWGCTKVSPACCFCYAEAWSNLRSQGRASWGPEGLRWIRAAKAGAELHALARAAAKRGVRERVFINSMSDIFEYHPGLDEAREYLFTRLLEVGYALDCLLLTKRPENIARMVPASWLQHWPAWIWAGTTVEDQPRADERIPLLLQIPACVRFLSCEPLLGPVNLRPLHKGFRLPVGWLEYGCSDRRIDWVICGGESGPKARPMHPDLARSLRDQCQTAGVPFFFKQWGEYLYLDQADAAGIKLPLIDAMNYAQTGAPIRVGKKNAGRLLDGREWNELPNAGICHGRAHP